MRQLPKRQTIYHQRTGRTPRSAARIPAFLKPQQGCAVVCHPHPLHGGTMQNKVAHTLARAFLGVGFAALRFNFRGVGESDGRFDDGSAGSK